MVNLRALLLALVAAPTVMAAAPAPTPKPLSDATLQSASALDLPSIVIVLQNVSGALHDDRDNATHGPFFGTYAGTGFFVTSDGYLVTAAHVAAPTPDLVKDELVDFDVDQTFHCNVETSADRCQSLEQQHHEEFAAATSVVNPNIDIRVLTQDLQPTADGLSAQVSASSPTAERDIAVLKVGVHDAPVSLLGDSGKVAVGETLAVIGYPVSGQTAGPTLVPTITGGRVVGKRTGDVLGTIARRAALLQVDAHTEHGNSGGPGVQRDGSVIGIVSFGDTQNHNFLVSAGDVIGVLAQTPAKNQLGIIDTLYRQALAATHRGDYSQAQQLFNQCAALNPAQIYCRDGALDAASAGSGRTQNATQAPTAVAAATTWTERALWAILGALLGAMLTLVAVRMRHRRSPAPAGATLAAGYGQPWSLAQLGYDPARMGAGMAAMGPAMYAGGPGGFYPPGAYGSPGYGPGYPMADAGPPAFAAPPQAPPAPAIRGYAPAGAAEVGGVPSAAAPPRPVGAYPGVSGALPDAATMPI